MTRLLSKLNSLNNIYSIWYFNKYLRVTYVSENWLIIWDHRHSPPERHDIKGTTNDHQAVCLRSAEKLNELAQKGKHQ